MRCSRTRPYRVSGIAAAILGVILCLYVPAIAKAGTVTNTFERKKTFKQPHRHNTTRQALTIQDGVASFTVRPGMHGASNDEENGKERAEIFVDTRTARWIRQSFRVRVPPGFRAPRRTMISQIKPDGKGRGSPPVAVYMTGTGEAKCNPYEAKHVIVRTSRFGIDLTDGNWHSVVMDLVRAEAGGYCRVMVDGKVIVEMSGQNSDVKGERYFARIGPYRDAMPFDQTVIYDDWVVQFERRVPDEIRALYE